MRTVAEIKLEMTTAFMADSDIRTLYDPAGTWAINELFDDKFAKSSVESIIFHIIAVICYGMEFLFARHVAEVATYEERMRVGTREWWRQLAFRWQYGDALTFNSATNTYEYAVIDETAKIIKYVDVRETADGLVMLVAKQGGSGPVPLASSPPDERNAFEAYIRKTKIAGIPLDWESYDADQLRMELEIVFDPLVMNTDGELISGGTKPVDLAIAAYLANIPYGSGELNKTQLIDAIQASEGVVDVYPSNASWLQVSTQYVPSWTPVLSQDLTAYGGSFAIDTLTINYTPNV
jgi:hypothetical protein